MKRNALTTGLLAATLLGVALLAANTLPGSVDYLGVFRPAALELLRGRSPYSLRGFYNPPWALLPFIPLALLPERLAVGVLFAIGYASMAAAAIRLGAGRAALLVFLVSPPVVHNMLNGNLEWLVLLGLGMPPSIGIFFISVKPQSGAAVALYWAIDIWRARGFRAVAHTFWPFACAIALSFLLFGLWPLHAASAIPQRWNASLWPYSIPLGLAVLLAAVIRRDERLALPASPMLSPYVMFHGWGVALAALLKKPAHLIAISLALWVWIVVRLP